MLSKRLILVMAALLVTLALAACAPVPPALSEPATLATSAPAATTQPGATATTAATATPVATPTPALPDPQTDPQAALMFASSGQLFQTAEFTYTMTLALAPADAASAEALGEQAAQLESFVMNVQGAGAMEVTNAETGAAKMRMDMEMDAAGQQMAFQMVMIDQTAWVKATGQEEWMRLEGDAATGALPASVDPRQMLTDFESAVDVEWIEDAQQDGLELSHLRFTMDPTKLDLAAITGNLTGDQSLTAEEIQAMVGDMKPVIDLWLTKPALQVHGQQMTLDWIMALPEEAGMGDAKIRFLMTTDMQFSSVNEPVTIEPPTE